MKELQTKIINGIIVYSEVYAPDEMPEYWTELNPYQRRARRMDDKCAVIKCDEMQAKEISAYVCNNIYPSPRSTYYDGVELSIDCSFSSNPISLKNKIINYYENYFNQLLENHWISKEYGVKLSWEFRPNGQLGVIGTKDGKSFRLFKEYLDDKEFSRLCLNEILKHLKL